MLSYKLDFNVCANRDGFHKSSHILVIIILQAVVLQKPLYIRYSSFLSLQKTRVTIRASRNFAFNSRVVHEPRERILLASDN